MMSVTITQLPSLLSQDEGTGTGSTFVFEVTRHLESVLEPSVVGVFYYLPGFTWSISGQTTSDDFVGGISGTVSEIRSGSSGLIDAYSTHQFQVVSNGDGYGEDNENFSVNLSWQSYYVEYPNQPGSGSPILVPYTNPLHVFSGVLVNDDLPAYLYIMAAGADKLEGTGVGVNWFDFNVTRSGELAIASTVNWAVEPIDPSFTADDISGLVLPSGTLVFSSGETQKTIQIPIFADNILEPDERFGIRLSSPSLGSLVSEGFATGIVRNDDSSVSISAGLAEAEGQYGLTELLYVVSRSGSLVEPCSVQWAVAGDSGSPADGSDFRGTVLPSGTLNFAAGSASDVIRFYVKADTNAELDENYKVTLANPIGTTLGTASAIGAILDDDLAGRADRVLEGQPYLINISRRVSVEYGLSGAYRHYVPALSWTVIPGSAGLDDFSVPLSGSYSEIDLSSAYPPYLGGMVYENIVINVGTRDDAQREATENFRLNTSETFYNWEFVPPTQPGEIGQYVRRESFSSSQYHGYILDNDLPELSIAPASAIIHEGSNGTPAASSFTVSRTGDLSLPTQVQWTVAGTGGNSVSPYDFGAATLPSGILDFPAGLASQTVQLLLSSDALNEQDEMFQINLSEPIGGRVSATAGSASVIVKNVDWIPPEIIAMSVEGSSVKLQFSEPINSTGLLPARFKASLVSTTTSTRSIASVSSVLGDPTLLVLTVSGAQPAGSQGVRIAYTDLSAANNLTGVVQDLAGNDMPTIAGLGRAAETFISFSNVLSLNSSYSSLILKGLAVVGAGNSADNNLTVVQDTPVSNVFDGAAGIDSMDAGDGADIYLVSVGDHHGGAEIHDSGASGSDELRFASNVQDDCLVIYSGDTGLERVVIGTGTGASAVSAGLTSLDVDASSAPNSLVITGNYGANLLVGSAFSDTINGNRGNDILLGGDGQDVFVFNSPLNSLTNKDCLLDFKPLKDKIQLDNSVFTGLLLDGLLSPAALGFGLKATTVDHRIIYHNSSGRLIYDSNGSLPGGSSVFAVLPTGLQSSIDAGIFEVI